MIILLTPKEDIICAPMSLSFNPNCMPVVINFIISSLIVLLEFGVAFLITKYLPPVFKHLKSVRKNLICTLYVVLFINFCGVFVLIYSLF